MMRGLLENILVKIQRLAVSRRWHGAGDRTQDRDCGNTAQDTGQRLRELYGEARMNQQLLYEQWAVKDTWHLRDEALPLLYGMDPGSYKNNRGVLAEEEAIKGLWLHARQCIEHNLLRVANREQAPEEWRVEPLDIYQWAVVSRLQLPEPFVALMEFVGRTVKKSPQPVTPAASADGGRLSAAFDDEREKVLGLALAVLASCPEQCRNAAGEVTAGRILETCTALSCLPGQSPQLADGAMLDLIDKWLKAVPPAPSS